MGNCKTENLECIDSDGVEFEVWECQKCGELFSVPISIERRWDEAEKVEEGI